MKFDATATILLGDAREKLKELEAESVQCTVTSPPYYGLRDYGTARWEGGDPECTHSPKRKSGNATSTLGGGKSTTSHAQEGFLGETCPKCGAIRIDNQIGLEATPEEYVSAIVDVFREIWRVTRKDGVAWLNIDDSYAGSNKGMGKNGKAYACPKQATNKGSVGVPVIETDIQSKSLMLIPFRLAIALQDDGWLVRCDVIWNKPNAMPESVTDRPTRAHEYLFLLTKSQSYYYNSEAVLEPYTKPLDRWGGDNLKADGQSSWDEGTGQSSYRDRNMRPNPNGRNRRSVWNINTVPYKEAHFATFPPDLIEPCILAGSREGDTVLDPFGGSGTTGMVALKHHRNAILIDANPEYIKLQKKRLQVTPRLL